MAAIRPLSSIRDKWTRVTQMRGSDYKAGVANPRRDWAKSTEAQKEAWRLGITEAANNDRFAKGVRKAGTEKWQSNALKKGPGRFAEGVMVAGPEYEKGYAPYRDTIEKTTLPPRYPKGDPRNIERVKVLAMALRKKKLEG